MDELNAFERRLAAGLEAYAGPRRSIDAVAIARTTMSRSQVRSTILPRFSVRGFPAPVAPWAAIGIIVLLLLLLVAVVVVVGSRQRGLVPPSGPAGNGLIAYDTAGDIFVGDPVTATTTAIVTGPPVDSGPIFSPDGLRVAFRRDDQESQDASIVVVRADGSDPRMVAPAGFSKRGFGFAWTPDSASLVVNHDGEPHTTPYFDGKLSLFDASGVAEPRLLTPPLPAWPGTAWFNPNAQVAPMFRPPNGDLILSGNYKAIDVFDADLTRVKQLGQNVLEAFDPHVVWWPAWSPDGSLIAFGLAGEMVQLGSFVLNADGSDLRRLAPDGTALAWSPDGSRIALEWWPADQEPPGAVIVIVDVASGTEHVLGATSVDTKVEGDVPSDPNFHGVTSPTGRKWDYEGWSWSPDGRSILMLERHGTRPIVVEVATGQVTELPWEADSAPSWQRISAD